MFSSEQVRSERATVGCRSTNVDGDLAMATHSHRDFRIDALLSDLPSASGDNQHVQSATGGHHRRAHSQRNSGGSTRSKKREEYDPELEKLVRERVYDLHVRVQAHEQQVLPSNERESPVAPAVPPRGGKRAASNHTNTRESKPLPPAPPEARNGIGHTTKTCACGSCLGSPGEVCQQCSSGVVISGDHDYINQDHLDTILEEQEEVECKRKRQDSEDGEDFMDEATADAVIGQAKDRRGKVGAWCCGHELFACCESCVLVITDLYMWDLAGRMKVLLIYGVYMYVQSKV